MPEATNPSESIMSKSRSERGKRFIRRTAVLGAGVMGSQIAALLANAGLSVLLYDLPANGDEPSPAVATLKRLTTMKPAALAADWRASLITAVDYDHDLERLSACDLVIEVIAERADLKTALLKRIQPHLKASAILTSNTSGLSIAGLCQGLPLALKRQFCGLHFFNPPRYMRLVELTPGPDTDAEVMDTLETFVTRVLGKSVVRAGDSPNFIANRIGILSLVSAVRLAKRMNLSPDLVDALTGTCIGRPKSATFRTMDIVGLDVIAHVLEDSVRDLKSDPWNRWLSLPDWVLGLIEGGSLGQKSGVGIYRKQDGVIEVFNPASGHYRPATAEVDSEVKAILRVRDWGEKLAALRELDHPQAQFVWTLMRTVMLYAAWTLKDIADNARDLDLAMRWGFGWQMGPLEVWQAAGWSRVRGWIAHDIAKSASLAEAPLPSWVYRVDDVHLAEGSYSPLADGFRPRSKLPVYQRQLFPDRVYGEVSMQPQHLLFETDDACLWHMDDGVAILSFGSKMHVIGDGVMDAIMDAVAIAESDFDALVIWHPSEPFCAGANLLQIAAAIEEQEFDAIEAMIERFQQATTRLRQCCVPTVAAVSGLAIGGGCEVLMHCDRVAATRESYIGLVETGVGLIPAGGGCKELARRAYRRSPDGNPWPLLKNWFETVAKATVSGSAEQAMELGFLQRGDALIMHRDELLYVAKAQAKALAATGYRPSPIRPIRVAGRTAAANFHGQLVNLREGEFISDHDFKVAGLLADTLTGGDLDPGTEVDEDWFLVQERKAFLELVKEEKTYERIVHTLQTGKALRN